NGIRHKPHTTFGNVKADVIADKEPGFSSLVTSAASFRQSCWPS
ncbi:phosphohydrolase, partial [Pseudomonas putida]